MNHLRPQERVKLGKVGNALKRPLAPALSPRERETRRRAQTIVGKNVQASLLGLLQNSGEEG
jgi:hypothetical protein